MEEKMDMVEWEQRYKEWEGSGENQRAYCKQAGINFHTFKQKTHQLIQSGKIKSLRKRGSRRRPGAFVPIILEEEQKKECEVPYCELKFRDGGRIVVEELKGIQQLGQLLQGFRHA